MDYKALMGYGKTTKKKVVKEQKKPSVVDNIKQELNEWSDTTFRNKPKRWSKPYGKSLTEFEENITEKVMKIKYYKTISKEEWNKTYKDYKSVIDGVKYKMFLDPQKGTILAPVIVK
tara:strand:+ start:372 stop:722 length:351 start_codon:yes stop_codon:yes gene_type:complete